MEFQKYRFPNDLTTDRIHEFNSDALCDLLERASFSVT
jgi:hypothetical protein